MPLHHASEMVIRRSERCAIAYPHSNNASQEESKRQCNEPSTSQAREVLDPDVLPEWLQLLEFPSAVRAISNQQLEHIMLCGRTAPPEVTNCTVRVPQVQA